MDIKEHKHYTILYKGQVYYGFFIKIVDNKIVISCHNTNYNPYYDSNIMACISQFFCDYGIDLGHVELYFPIEEVAVIE